MIKAIAKETVLALTESICDDLEITIKSVSLVNESMEAIDDIIKDMSLIEVLLNVDSITEKMMAQNRVKDEKEKAILIPLMQAHMDLKSICIKREIPTIREYSRILSELQIGLDKFEEFYKDNKEVKIPGGEFYKKLFTLLNFRIIIQK